MERAAAEFNDIFTHIVVLSFGFPFVFVKLLALALHMNFLRRSLDYALLGGFKRKVPSRARWKVAQRTD